MPLDLKSLIMRKVLYSFIGLFISGSAMASADLFEFDYADVVDNMTEVATLKSYVITNDGVTYSELAESNSNLIDNIEGVTTFPSAAGDGPIGIPSFLLGCCLSVIGVLIVYLITEDSEETKKALFGCILGTIAGAIIYVVYVLWILSQFQSWVI
jgi:hypothetical protein